MGRIFQRAAARAGFRNDAKSRGGVSIFRVATTLANHDCEQLNFALLSAGSVRHDRKVINCCIFCRLNQPGRDSRFR